MMKMKSASYLQHHRPRLKAPFSIHCKQVAKKLVSEHAADALTATRLINFVSLTIRIISIKFTILIASAGFTGLTLFPDLTILSVQV